MIETMIRSPLFTLLIALTIFGIFLNEVTILQYPAFVSSGATISYDMTSTVYLADSGKVTNYVYTMSDFVKSGQSTWGLDVSTVTANGAPVSVKLESERNAFIRTTYYVFTAPEKVNTLQIDGYTFTNGYVEEHPVPTAIFVTFLLIFFVFMLFSKPPDESTS